MGSIADYCATVWLTDKDGHIKKQLCSVSNDIYYIDNEDEDEGNETTDEFVVTQKFIDSLKPGDKIYLQGDGNQY